MLLLLVRVVIPAIAETLVVVVVVVVIAAATIAGRERGHLPVRNPVPGCTHIGCAQAVAAGSNSDKGPKESRTRSKH